MNHLKELEENVSAWPEVSVYPHRFGGREFRFGSAEVGHVHANGIVDIPFPRALRDALLAEGLVEEHHWVPDSGWTTFRVKSELDVAHALWLFRLSYLRYVLRTDPDPHERLARESQALHLSAHFKPLFERIVPRAQTAS
jgi:Family of unknown function (DUF5519)